MKADDHEEYETYEPTKANLNINKKNQRDLLFQLDAGPQTQKLDFGTQKVIPTQRVQGGIYRKVQLDERGEKVKVASF